MVDLCVHVEADELAVLELLGDQLHLLGVDQPHGLVLAELLRVNAVVVAAGGQDALLLPPKLLQDLAVLLLVAAQPLDQPQQPPPEGEEQPPGEELELVAVLDDLQVLQGVAVGEQLVDVGDQVEAAVVGVQLPGKLSGKRVTSSW